MLCFLLKDHPDCYRVQGRAGLTDYGALCFDQTANALEFSAVCGGRVSVMLSVMHANFLRIGLGKDNTCCFAVEIDGERVRSRVALQGEGQFLTLCTDLPRGTHRFRVIKENRQAIALADIYAVFLDGKLLPAEEDTRPLIEIVGDSITCGWGNLDPDPADNGHRFEDGTQAYAYRLAQKLDCAYSILGHSGQGWLQRRGAPWTVAIPTAYEYLSYYRSHGEADRYTHPRTPALIVVHVGTNDAIDRRTEEELRTPVCDIVCALRRRFGDGIRVLFLMSTMDGYCDEAIESIVQSLNDGGTLYTLRTGRYTAGGKGHPHATEHALLCDEVYDFIHAHIPL